VVRLVLGTSRNEQHPTVHEVRRRGTSAAIEAWSMRAKFNRAMWRVHPLASMVGMASGRRSSELFTEVVVAVDVKE
jgi:hypothetical protein